MEKSPPPRKNSQSSDELPEPLPSVEVLREFLGSDKVRRELQEQVGELAHLLNGEGRRDSPPNEKREDTLLRSVYQLSDRLARGRKKRWSAGDQVLWDQFLDACYECEMESLGQQGHTPNKAERLVRRERAYWDPTSYGFTTEPEPEPERPDHRHSVQVVVVQREGGFRIHDEILRLLWEHPLLAGDVTASEGHHSRKALDHALERVESIEREHFLDDWEHIPLIAEQEGPDQLAAICAMAASAVRSALEASGSGGSDFFKDEEDHGEMEDRTWLTVAKSGGHLWYLLNAAIRLGQALDHYTTFHGSDIEEAIRRMKTIDNPGKRTSAAGIAVERLINGFSQENQNEATPTRLLAWLGGDRPQSDGEPLTIDHDRWESALAGVSWERFENLVKAAKRRL